jgi:subtilisin family serine protease
VVVAVLALVALSAPAAGAIGTAGDPLQPKQWGLAKIGAPAAWSTSTGKGVTIGIVDTGIDLQHEDLASKVVATANCIGSAGNPAACMAGGGQDDNGHGTHVSGIAAAETGNGKGVAGVAPDAKLVVAKVLDASGSGRSDDINAGIEWVVQHGAQVVNLSLSGNFLVTNVLGSPVSDGVNYAWQNGAIPVLAAGNDAVLLLGGSQNYGNANAVVVGATGPSDKVASYSSSLGNAKWGLVAPGGDGTADADHQILSTFWTPSAKNSYGVLEGTSMATPHVTGTLALLRAQGLGRDDAVQRLLSTADKSVSCGTDCAGRLDAAKAVGTPAAPAPATGTASAPAPAPTAAPAPAGPTVSRPPGTTAAPSGGAVNRTVTAGGGAAAVRSQPATTVAGVAAPVAPVTAVPDAPGSPAAGSEVAAPPSAVRSSPHRSRPGLTLGLALVAVGAVLAVVLLGVPALRRRLGPPTPAD